MPVEIARPNIEAKAVAIIHFLLVFKCVYLRLGILNDVACSVGDRHPPKQTEVWRVPVPNRNHRGLTPYNPTCP